MSAGMAKFAVEEWPLDRIKPYPGNPRKISQKAIDKVKASLQAFGWQQPIVVDRAGVIVVGHARREAAAQLGWTHAPVHIAANLTAAQAKAYRLADNRTGEEAQWDAELLGVELRDLMDAAFDTQLTGFDPAELDTAVTAEAAGPDEPAPAPPKFATSKAGDLWVLGTHRILCGDCTDVNQVELLLGQAKPRLMVTDPPYGVELEQRWRDDMLGRQRKLEGHAESSIQGDARCDWSAAFELVPTLNAIYVWHASQFASEVLASLKRLGFTNHQQIVWVKNVAGFGRGQYWYQHEPCWYMRRPGAAWHGVKGGGNTTVWAAASPKQVNGGSKEDKFDHPNQKPLELMRRPIRNHTRRGELVYEPFLGSGTTLAAAEELGRVCLGMEVDPKFVDVVILRWQKLTGKQATLEGRTFSEVAKARAKKKRAA